MKDTPKTAAIGWRQCAVIGLAIGLSVPASRAVAASLEPSLGPWLAFTASLIAATVVGGVLGLAALVLPLTVKPPADGPSPLA